MVEVAFLGSGSTGNCAVVRSGKTVLLLDAGLSPRQTVKRLAALGVALEDVSALLLTHEHSDHVASAVALAGKAGVPVYATAGTAAAARLPGPLFFDLRTVRGGSALVLGELEVRVASTPHDGVESVCYAFGDGAGRRVGVATDLGHLSREVEELLAGCDVLGLEANHDLELLRQGPYPPYLKRRILSARGHLSNDDAAAGVVRLVGPSTGSVVLLHLSQQNNTAALALAAVGGALEAAGARVRLEAARPDAPTGWHAATSEVRAA